MASTSPSSSPRWDSRWDHRNSGFVSPAQLQQWRQQQQQHEFQSAPAEPQSQAQPGMQRTTSRQDALPAQGPPPMPPTHTRSSSHFSLFKSKPQHNPQPSTASLPSRPVDSDPGEFGHQPRPPTSSQATSQATLVQNSKAPNVHTMSPGNGEGPTSQGQPPDVSTGPVGAPASGSVPPSPLPPLHPEIRSIVQLTIAHGRKIYFAGPLVRRVERQADGHRPTKDEGWRDVWGQLGGTTLSLWDMKEIEEASKQGRQVPPSYVNIMDAFVQVLGSVTIPATATSPSKKYTNVLTLNTAGMNLLLFSCPSTQALLSWTAALRLASWEKARLEEMYTAHLIRITLNDGRDAPTPLSHGKMEGWVRLRIAGQTEWKRLWMVVVAGGLSQDAGSVSSADQRPGSPQVLKKKRISSLFSRDHSPARSVPAKSFLQLFMSNKPKEKKKAVLTLREVTQAFAVYPERPELISHSSLMKVEGTLGDEELAGSLKNREAWLMLMPEQEAKNTIASEMLKWLIGVHDAFELYGRPRLYSWDPRDPRSMMFAYPIGPSKDLLFLDRELAEHLDPRDDRTSANRSQLKHILWERMRGSPEQSQSPGSGKDQPPTLPPLPDMTMRDEDTFSGPTAGPSGSQAMQLPPLQFESSRNEHALPELPSSTPIHRVLTPITERSDPQQSRSISMEPPANGFSASQSPPFLNQSTNGPGKTQDSTVLGEGVSASPTQTSSYEADLRNRHSEDSHVVPPSRPESKLDYFGTRQVTSPPSQNYTDTMNGKYSEPVPQHPPSAPQSPVGIPPPFSYVSKDLPVPASPRPSVHAHSQTMFDPSSPGPASPNFSALTSPYSIPDSPPVMRRPESRHSLLQDLPPPVAPTRRTNGSAPASPIPPSVPAPPLMSVQPQPLVRSPPIISQASPVEPEQDLLREAGALYYMRHIEQNQPTMSRRPPPPVGNDEDSETDSGSSYSPSPGGTHHGATSPFQTNTRPTSTSPPASSYLSHRGPPPTAFGQNSMAAASLDTAVAAMPPRMATGPVRKPSGARAAPVSKTLAARREGLQQQHPPDVYESNQYGQSEEQYSDEASQVPRQLPPRMVAYDDHEDNADAADALAALSFLEREELPPPESKSSLPPPPAIPQGTDSPSPSPPPSMEGGVRSSFAPSRQANQRKAQSQAQQAAHHAAVHKPGRINGRQKKKARDPGAWGESSDEEEDDDDEEEEEEEEEDADSDAEPPKKDEGRLDPRGSGAQSQASYPSTRGPSPARAPAGENNGYPRRPRDLPQLPQAPGQTPPGGSEEYLNPQPRRFVSDQFSEAGRRSMYPEGPRRQASPAQRPPQEFANPGAARQNMWSQVLERQGGGPEPSNSRDTFVQLEPPSQTMTKAFAPHGLLSAGLQDKQDRSAKRQEELARETGASLINVPNKPPPPQTGLLGAVTAHERERKREGGLGATLTEREREKRLAEERQRKLDEFQRMQLDQMQQGGSMYGGMGMPPQFTGYNPMMGNPMMMGMNPMMTGGWGYPNMMNPQHMFAAQQAAQAYQQAMMAFSTTGSQAGGEAGGANTPLNPMMTGGGMSMAGFDPRLSMMGMPMMSPSMTGMGMGQGMPPMVPGMGQGMGQMNPMGMGMGGIGMQMTGGSNFDARYSPGNDGAAGSQLQYSQNSSALGQGSPSGTRPLDHLDDSGKRIADDVR